MIVSGSACVESSRTRRAGGTVDRTELREAFFAEVHTDPWTHALTDLYARAWVEGYEQALRDNGLTGERLRKSYSERRGEAVEYLTDRKRQAEAEFLVAMAGLGKMAHRASS
jgi:HEPN domain-containing protein